MNFDAIERVSRALEDAVQAAFAGANVPGDVYVGPLDDADAQEAAAVLFLYRLVANADLRGAEHRVPSPDAQQPATVHRGGLPLDLYYLLTAGTARTGGELPALRALGCAMQALNDRPELLGVAVGGETVRVSLEPTTTEEMSRIWSLFPTANFRTSVVYLASPVWVDPAVVRAVGPPVLREPHRAGPLVPGGA
jgi:hypothetical protein